MRIKLFKTNRNHNHFINQYLAFVLNSDRRPINSIKTKDDLEKTSLILVKLLLHWLSFVLNELYSIEI